MITVSFRHTSPANVESREDADDDETGESAFAIIENQD